LRKPARDDLWRKLESETGMRTSHGLLSKKVVENTQNDDDDEYINRDTPPVLDKFRNSKLWSY
jgi:hypothetical protein